MLYITTFRILFIYHQGVILLKTWLMAVTIVPTTYAIAGTVFSEANYMKISQPVYDQSMI